MLIFSCIIKKNQVHITDQMPSKRKFILLLCLLDQYPCFKSFRPEFTYATVFFHLKHIFCDFILKAVDACRMNPNSLYIF